MTEYLKQLAEGETLTEAQAADAMHLMMRGEAEPEHMAGFLMALRARGETIPELVGFTRVMREYAVPVEIDDPHAIDVCGTGGDGAGTFNISTVAGFVCAGAGVTVAKHGNRAVSSACGSADVLETLGVHVGLRKEGAEHCLREAGIAFLFAPHFHPAMRNVMPVRRKLGVRTFFNILGPLCNPAGVRRQLLGAFSEDVAQRMVSILIQLGADHVVAVHAQDGTDELSLSAPTAVFEYRADAAPTGRLDKPQVYELAPEKHGLGRVPLNELGGGSAEDNAEILRAVLDGQEGPHRDVVLLNSAYALHTSGRFDSIDTCFEAARESIDAGAARRRLDQLIEVSQEAARFDN